MRDFKFFWIENHWLDLFMLATSGKCLAELSKSAFFCENPNKFEKMSKNWRFVLNFVLGFSQFEQFGQTFCPCGRQQRIRLMIFSSKKFEISDTQLCLKSDTPKKPSDVRIIICDQKLLPSKIHCLFVCFLGRGRWEA